MTDVLPSNGTYELYVDDSSCGEGTSQLQVYNSPMLTGTIGVNGSTVTAVSNVPGQQTQLTFTGSANESVSLQSSHLTYEDCYGGSELAELTGPTGNYVNEADLCGSGGFGPVTLSSNGIYTITVEPFGATGSVGLTLTSP